MKNLFHSLVPVLAFAIAFFAAEIQAGPLTDFERSIMTRWAANPGDEQIRKEYIQETSKDVQNLQKLLPMQLGPFARLLAMEFKNGKTLWYKYQSAATSVSELILSPKDAHERIRGQICNDVQAVFFLTITEGSIEQTYVLADGLTQFAEHRFTLSDCAEKGVSSEEISV